ncbi:MAG: chemotaxis protein [Lachnospiraceae bacterium]|nr:chemotaxis protein [Lachnospiraceae bacterium]
MEPGSANNHEEKELQLLEFKLGEYRYGINVAKVKEIITYQPTTPVPLSHPGVEGIFMPRDEMLTAIDLKVCLGIGQSEPTGSYILTNFNKLHIAFHVDSIVGIHDVTWADIMKPGAATGTGEDSVTIGVIKYEGRLINLLDFEKIVGVISPSTTLDMDQLESLGPRSRNDIPIILAEDSQLLNRLIVESLESAGYDNIRHFENGKDAYDFILKCADEGMLAHRVGCIITDIEMPVMDGHTFTKLVKSNGKTSHIPLIIFSSLVNDEMRKKGEKLGADRQVSKPEIGSLVSIIDELVGYEE